MVARAFKPWPIARHIPRPSNRRNLKRRNAEVDAKRATFHKFSRLNDHFSTPEILYKNFVDLPAQIRDNTCVHVSSLITQLSVKATSLGAAHIAAAAVAANPDSARIEDRSIERHSSSPWAPRELIRLTAKMAFCRRKCTSATELPRQNSCDLATSAA